MCGWRLMHLMRVCLCVLWLCDVCTYQVPVLRRYLKGAKNDPDAATFRQYLTVLENMEREAARKAHKRRRPPQRPKS